MRSWLPVRTPSIRASRMARQPLRLKCVSRAVRTYICLALALVLIWDFGSRLLEWLTTGQLRVWFFFGNLDHYVIFSQEPVSFVFGFVTMSVMGAVRNAVGIRYGAFSG